MKRFLGRLKSDHIAGAFFIALGLVVLALSRDLPIGRLAAPGAGMMPVIVIVLMIVFGLVLVLRAGKSTPLAAIPWGDLKHALAVMLITAAAVYAYEWLGFIVDMCVLIVVLLVAVERRPVVPAVLFGVGLSLGTYFLFTIALKTPLKKGVLEFLL